MIHNRSDFYGSFLGYDEWWLTGGNYNDTTSELISSTGSSFREYVPLPEGLSRHVMVRLNESLVVILGNFFPGSDRVYLFDNRDQSFTPWPSMLKSREWPSASKAL